MEHLINVMAEQRNKTMDELAAMTARAIELTEELTQLRNEIDGKSDNENVGHSGASAT